MGGQQGKERNIPSVSMPMAGTLTRSGRMKYRSGKEIRPGPANVFTEHNGKFYLNYQVPTFLYWYFLPDFQ